MVEEELVRNGTCTADTTVPIESSDRTEIVLMLVLTPGPFYQKSAKLLNGAPI